MLYLEDYLELIEHLPQELRDRLTYIRESDLKVNNSSLQLEAKVKQFFAQAKDLSPEQRQCEYEAILDEFQKTKKFADEKVDTSAQTHEIMVKLIQKLDVELEKFKLELEADHAGMTEELERRSLELDADTRLDDMINGHLNNGTSNHNHNTQVPSVIKDRRRSEYKHRHHPYKHNHHNGYGGRDRLSHNYEYNTSKNSLAHNPRQVGSKHVHQHQSRQNSTASSPQPYGLASSSAPGSVNGDSNGLNSDGNGHYGNNITTFGFKHSHIKNNNLPLSQQHSALSAALSSATPTTPLSTFAMMNNASVQKNKISKQSTSLKGNDIIYSNNPFDKQNQLDDNGFCLSKGLFACLKDETKYCLCRQISYGEMIACDNEECEIEWFHYGCVGITQSPKGKWYCPECRGYNKNNNYSRAYL